MEVCRFYKALVAAETFQPSEAWLREFPPKNQAHLMGKVWISVEGFYMKPKKAVRETLERRKRFVPPGEGTSRARLASTE
jgi:hypothetical protein